MYNDELIFVGYSINEKHREIYFDTERYTEWMYDNIQNAWFYSVGLDDWSFIGDKSYSKNSLDLRRQTLIDGCKNAIFMKTGAAEIAALSESPLVKNRIPIEILPIITQQLKMYYFGLTPFTSDPPEKLDCRSYYLDVSNMTRVSQTTNHEVYYGLYTNPLAVVAVRNIVCEDSVETTLSGQKIHWSFCYDDPDLITEFDNYSQKFCPVASIMLECKRAKLGF